MSNIDGHGPSVHYSQPAPPSPPVLVAVVLPVSMQGASVVEALLAEPTRWKVRALFRNPAANKAKALEARGCEIVGCDLGSKPSLIAAFEGCKAVVGLSNAWEPDVRGNPDLQDQRSRLLVEAATVCKVQHLIWSGLPSSAEISKGEHYLADYQAKHRAQLMISSEFANAFPYVTFLYVGMTFQNLQLFMQPVSDYGELQFHSPLFEHTALPLCDIADVGLAVRECLRKPARFGKLNVIPVVAELLTLTQICAEITQATSRPARHVQISMDLFAATNSKEAVDGMHYWNTYGFGDPRRPEEARKIPVALKTFSEWRQECGWLNRNQRSKTAMGLLRDP